MNEEADLTILLVLGGSIALVAIPVAALIWWLF